MRCKCGFQMLWNGDYVNGVFITWYSCPMCGYSTKNQRIFATSNTVGLNTVYDQFGNLYMDSILGGSNGNSQNG